MADACGITVPAGRPMLAAALDGPLSPFELDQEAQTHRAIGFANNGKAFPVSSFAPQS